MEHPPITSAQNRHVSLVRRILSRPQEARREGVLVADGIHLVQEAIRVGLGCRSLFVTIDEGKAEITAILAIAHELHLPVYRVIDNILRSISSLETPQGVVGVFERPGINVPRGGGPGGDHPGIEDAVGWDKVQSALGHVAIADGLQDPANIGSLARSALGAGFRALITTPGTVDPFHHRALRAAQGASFRLPQLLDEPVVPLVNRLRQIGYLTVGLCAGGDQELTDLDPARPTALFLGGEGAGLSPIVLDAVSRRVRIPIEPDVESLGVAVAGAVAFFWLRLARRIDSRVD
jgi:TrmH family RNA methyltransferase